MLPAPAGKRRMNQVRNQYTLSSRVNRRKGAEPRKARIEESAPENEAKVMRLEEHKPENTELLKSKNFQQPRPTKRTKRYTGQKENPQAEKRQNQDTKGGLHRRKKGGEALLPEKGTKGFGEGLVGLEFSKRGEGGQNQVG